MDIEIGNLDSIGAVRDMSGVALPPEAFTYAKNVYFRDGGVERASGASVVFGTPGTPPHFLMQVRGVSQSFWLYTSLTKAYVWDGFTHTDVTRVSQDYTAVNTRDWNGTLLGGVPILNNGNDVPQYWSTLNVNTRLEDLANWPTGVRARVIRAFESHLFALNVTKSGTPYPHMVKWSHPADPGTVPVSWDHTDPTRDAGEVDLPDSNAGVIVDGMPLRDNLYIYKEGSVWRASFVGGAFVFRFSVFLESAGILAPRCVALLGDGMRHIVATRDDIIVHDGNSARSILERRYRRYLFGDIDQNNFLNSFIVVDPINSEAWFCYPQTGNTHPNRAVVWKYGGGEDGVLSERDVIFRNATVGQVESGTLSTWDSFSSAWNSSEFLWNASTFSALVGCNPDAGKFYRLNSGLTFDGEAFSGIVRREGLAIVGRTRRGDWVVDYKSYKLLNRIWIKASGGPIDVRVGVQKDPNTSVNWMGPYSFDPATQSYVDVVASGRAISLEFSGNVPFRVVGYKIEVSVISSI